MEIIVLSLPSVVGFVFAAILNQRKYKTLAERFMMMFLVVVSFFLFFDAYTVYPQAYSPAKVFCLICNAFFAPCIGITICFVSWSLHSIRQRYRRPFLTFYLLACVIFLIELLNYIGFGFDRAADFYERGHVFPPECETDVILYHIYSAFEYVAIYLYNVFCVVAFAVSLVFTLCHSFYGNFGPVVLFNYLFRRGPLRVIHVWLLSLLLLYLWAGVRIFWGSPYLTKNPGVTMGLYIFAAVSILFLGLVSLNLRKPCVYLRRPHRVPMYEDLPVHILELEEEHRLNDLSSFDEDEEADSYRTLNVREALRRLMRDQACFLYPGQSRYYVADILGLRRDAFDRTMHILHHISYEEYVMVQRIEYCRRYRDRYTNESEVEISMACGFPSLQEMQFEWRECRAYFRRADKYLEEHKNQEEEVSQN